MLSGGTEEGVGNRLRWYDNVIRRYGTSIGKQMMTNNPLEKLSK